MHDDHTYGLLVSQSGIALCAALLFTCLSVAGVGLTIRAEELL